MLVFEAVQAAIKSSDEQFYESRLDRVRKAASEAEEVLRAMLPGADTVFTLTPLSIESARSQLQPNEALLVLHSGSSNLYGFALRKAGDPFLFFSKSGADLLTEKIARLRRDATGYGSIDIANAEALYFRLLRPAETYLEGIDHLLVVADGQLLGLPWAALSTAWRQSRCGRSRCCNPGRESDAIVRIGQDGETGRSSMADPEISGIRRSGRCGIDEANRSDRRVGAVSRRWQSGAWWIGIGPGARSQRLAKQRRRHRCFAVGEARATPLNRNRTFRAGNCARRFRPEPVARR